MHKNGKSHRQSPSETYKWMLETEWFGLRNRAWDALMPEVGVDGFALITLILRESIGRGLSECSFTNEELAQRMRVSFRTVQRLKKRLIQCGWIVERRHWSQKGESPPRYSAGTALWRVLGEPERQNDMLRRTTN